MRSLRSELRRTVRALLPALALCASTSSAKPRAVARTASLASSSAAGARGALPLAEPSALANDEPARTFRDSLPLGPIPPKSKAAQNAGLSPGACKALARKRALALKPWGGSALGVSAPLRVAGEVGGVRFVTPGGKSPYGVLDCRLALALADLTPVLRRHHVVEVRIDNMYRPHAHLPGKKKPSQHAYGLAADITSFKLEDGSELVVERDFSGEIGAPVCGPEAAAQDLSAPAVALRNLVCDVARSEIFHHILTPNHDRAHRDHFHFDIARGARSRIIE